MDPLNHLSELTRIIQAAVAPVFLLAGVAGFLNVMTGRLGRIVDRQRVVQRRILTLSEPTKVAQNNKELQVLMRRIRLINWAVGLCTLSGLMICFVVMTLFVGSYWDIRVDLGIVLLFAFAMISLSVALLLFLKETHLATRTMVVASEYLDG